jgi:hypothetical protein
LYESDYFPFLLKNKNNKQLLPIKQNRYSTAGLKIVLNLSIVFCTCGTKKYFQIFLPIFCADGTNKNFKKNDPSLNHRQGFSRLL